ncbi:MAG: [protein-PII] uridylyltransferase [Deltaproteobacteria bacterium]
MNKSSGQWSVVSGQERELDLSGSDILKAVKDYLYNGVEALRIRHRQGASGFDVVKGYTALIDFFIKALFERMESLCREGFKGDFRTAVVAMGGYGRGELNIRSDIDLMLLHPNKLTPYIEKLTQRILYILWDTGLDVGFSIRSVNECISLAKSDLKTKTAMLDLRFITGDRGIFDELSDKVKKEVFRKKDIDRFINDKLDENNSRHVKYGGSVYILEPNVKEGEGGLRDIHTAMWIAKVSRGIDNIETLAEQGFLLKDSTGKINGSIDFLWRVRNDLHFESKKKADQLTFDHQERIAKLFGFEDTKESITVERFMQEYYRHASNLSYFSSLIISRCIHGAGLSTASGRRMEKAVDKDFGISQGELSVLNERVFEDSPPAIMKTFEYCQEFGIKTDNFTRERIIKNCFRVDNDFINSKDVAGSFMNILKSGRAFSALEEMRKLRLLERYIPEFRDITCRVQHDMYHVYTVDVHSLFAVRELERLRTSEYKKEFFILATLIEEVKRPELLTLAVLLHDIGKSMGKGHAEKGAELVPGICGRLGLSEDDTAVVKFLVKNHLILADTAQYRDLHDERLVIDFAKKAGDIERLNLLYLITFADVRAVGPEVWNKWKGALFQELYFKALTIMERGTFEVEEAVKRVPNIMGEVAKSLEGEIAYEIIEDYFQLLPHRYFLSNSTEAISEHLKIVQELHGKPYVMRIKQNLERRYTEVIICTLDIHGLFSRITGVMASNNINILGAQINTLRNGIVLDILQTNSSMGDVITDEYKWANVEKDMADVLTGNVLVERLVAKRGPSILDKKAKPRVHTRIEVDNEVSDAFTVIDIHTQDRIGLLYTITSALSKLGLYIHIAKIATKGDAAADIFYVKDIFGQKIYFKERLKEIRDTIFRSFGEEPPAGEEE